MYIIIKTTPNTKTDLGSRFWNIRDARQFLSIVLKRYKADAPKGERRKASRWQEDRNGIICDSNGDEIRYIIKKTGKAKNHE